MNKNEKMRLIKKYETKSPLLKNFLMSFLFGGAICLLGELIKRGLIYLEISPDDARALTTVILIFIASVLTGLGIFDKIARHAGAGTLVPVTGFSNAVTSQAMDSGSEGIILGVGAKIFTIAGPVILYGVSASAVYGLIYWITTLF